MTTYFRAQTKGYSFEQMLSHTSGDGGDGYGAEVGGLCACLSVSELLSNTVWGALDADDEVVLLTAQKLQTIYDGYRVRPIAEVARFTVAEFRANAEQIAWDYEDYE